jgi:hypothetical protein
MDFQTPYSRQTYLDFLQHQLLPEDFKLADEKITDFKPDRIKSCLKVADVPSLDLTVLEIEHESENDPRVSLSRETFRLLANYGKQRALVLFTSRISPNYRFSLVTVDLELEGKKVKREYSNPRRLSFFLGPDAKIHTPQEYLLKPGRVKDFNDLKDRFSIEVVTKEFYREYAEVFAQIESAIAKNNKLSKPDLRLYTQMLMNRLMFLRFLEKKKWVKFGESSDYLANLYAAGRLNKQSFFITRLCPLFFEALAIEGKQESDAVGKTAFLNGGLFERGKLDEKVQDIPDAAFKNLLGPDGLFYKFNFTVEESTPIDIEVSVDPEMLGKVFEELVTGRHETGSYYTPRPIVSFMCKEALKGYLTSKTSASKEAIALLVDEHQIAPDLTDRHAEEILFYLETIKAVDPACGSGAYLLGLLQELIEIRKTLQNQQLKSDPDFIYKLKLRLISSCLYGVDIDPFATNIAKLRLWLSLSVEADSPQPLPNLDFKIETGDSILGPCDIYADRPDALVMSALRKKAQQLVLKKDRYMLAHGEEKQKLYDEIVAEEKTLAEQTGTVVGEGVIAWHIHFAEVFTRGRRIDSTFEGQFGFMADAQRQKLFKITTYEPGGFDIVLANPPYGIVFNKDLKKTYEKAYPTFKRNNDIYVAFIERGISLLAVQGTISYINPNTYQNGDYFQKLRHLMVSDLNIFEILDFKNLPVFCDPTVFVSIFIGQRSSKGSSIIRYGLVKSYDEVIKKEVSIIQISKTDKDLFLKPKNKIIQSLYCAPDVNPLGEKFFVKDVGFNYWTIGKGKKRDGNSIGDRILYSGPKRHKRDIPFLKGRNIDRYLMKKTDNYLKHNYQEFLKPNVDVFGFSEAFLTRSPKIIYRQTSPDIRATIDYDKNYLDKTVHLIVPKAEDQKIDLKYVLCLLNSKLFQYVYSYLSQENRGRAFAQVKTTYIKKLPLKVTSAEEQNKFINLVDKILAITRSDDYQNNDSKQAEVEKLEEQIDQMVYKLYGLTPDEIAIIQKTS